MPLKPKAETDSVVSHPLGTELYTTTDAAHALRLSVRAILNAIGRGDLEARKVGKQYLMTREAVKQFWAHCPLAKATKTSHPNAP
jgi:excisionase family DNA binding protein